MNKEKKNERKQTLTHVKVRLTTMIEFCTLALDFSNKFSECAAQNNFLFYVLHFWRELFKTMKLAYRIYSIICLQLVWICTK